MAAASKRKAATPKTTKPKAPKATTSKTKPAQGLLFDGSEWTFQKLETTYAAIQEIAEEDLGLEVYPNPIEIISSASSHFKARTNDVFEIPTSSAPPLIEQRNCPRASRSP